MFDFDAHEAALTAHVTRRMIELAALERGARVLDVGCGRGQVAFECLAAIEPGGSVLGLDVDEAAVAAVNARAVPSVRAVLASAEQFGCDRRFDAALARWSLASMSEPAKALGSVAAVLEPGAPFVVGTWASAEWWSVPRALIGRFAALPAVDSRTPSALRFAAIEAFTELAAPWFEVEAVEQLATTVVEGAPEWLLAWTEHVFARWIALVPVDARAAFRADALGELRTLRSLRGVTHLACLRRSAT